VRRAAAALGALALLVGAAGPASASRCAFEPQGEGRVAGIIDARSFRLQDGREIRLTGIEPGLRERASGQALAKILLDRDVTLRGVDDAPDRYGRQDAFVFLGSSESSVQEELLDQGEALVSATVTDKECASALAGAEAAARRAKRGIWADPAVIKNTESPGDILTGIGRFTLVEGRVWSVRQAGTTTYLNFGRNWTRGFAVTISRRASAVFEAAGIQPKSFESRRIRVRVSLRRMAGRELMCSGWGRLSCLAGISPRGKE
jgi:endonuclease YncB( thermonuclease family)